MKRKVKLTQKSSVKEGDIVLLKLKCSQHGLCVAPGIYLTDLSKIRCYDMVAEIEEPELQQSQASADVSIVANTAGHGGIGFIHTRENGILFGLQCVKEAKRMMKNINKEWPYEDRPLLSQDVRRWINEQRWTYDRLAALLDCSESTIKNWLQPGSSIPEKRQKQVRDVIRGAIYSERIIEISAQFRKQTNCQCTAKINKNDN